MHHSKAVFLFLSTACCLVLLAAAQAPESPAPSPGEPPSGESECKTIAIDNLGECLEFLINDSTVMKPSADCCSGFSNVSYTKPLCLCDLVSNNSTFADEFSVNRTRALSLPNLCNIPLAAVELCSAAGYQVGSPGSAPAAPPNKCTAVVVSELVSCIKYAQKGSNETAPTQACCSDYSSLLKSDEKCLCDLLSDTVSVLPGIQLNMSRAITLPGKCGARIPTCSSADAPRPRDSAAGRLEIFSRVDVVLILLSLAVFSVFL